MQSGEEQRTKKSDRKMKPQKRNKLQEETADSTNRRAEQSLSDGMYYHYGM